MRIKRLIKGFIGRIVLFWVKIRKSANTTIIYAGPLMGDALYSMAFIEEYKRQNPQKKVLIWTSPKLVDTIATCQGYDELKVLKSRMVRSLIWQIWNSDPKLHDKAIASGLLNQFAFRDTYAHVSEMDVLRNRIFQVGVAASISYHHVIPQKVTSIANFYKDCYKIVVLNPYSNTTHLSGDIMSMFERLAYHIKQWGIIVYTNVISNQQPINGTNELRCNLAELLEIAYHIPLIISVRSGILDFLVKTNVNMFILYGAEKINIESYGLKAWECNGIIEEHTYVEFLLDDKFERFDKLCGKILKPDNV